jgi:hypothetical protein
MPTTVQKVMIGEELLTAMRLLKTGLRELNRMSGETDFFHLPILSLSSGLERLMKVVICCHHLETKGEFPDRGVLSKRGKNPTHDLTWLLDQITTDCYSDEYLSQTPAAEASIKFLRTDDKLRRIVEIMSQFAQGARYYNLNVVLGDADPGPSPDDQWQRLELEALKNDPAWADRIVDAKQSHTIHCQINRELTVHSERLTRALSRLFTIGGLGVLPKQISCYTHHFLFMTDKDLGATDYESVRI